MGEDERKKKIILPGLVGVEVELINNVRDQGPDLIPGIERETLSRRGAGPPLGLNRIRTKDPGQEGHSFYVLL